MKGGMEAAKEKGIKGLTLVSLLCNYSIVYLAFSCLSISQPLLIENLHLTNAEIGNILFISTISRVIPKFFAGPLVDTLGARPVLMTFLFLTLAGVFLFAFGSSVVYFIIVWSFVKCCTVPCWPACVKITANWFPPSQASLALAVLSLSYLFGDAVIRAYLATFIHFGASWQTLFMAASITAFVIFVEGLVVIRPSPSYWGLRDVEEDHRSFVQAPKTVVPSQPDENQIAIETTLGADSLHVVISQRDAKNDGSGNEITPCSNIERDVTGNENTDNSTIFQDPSHTPSSDGGIGGNLAITENKNTTQGSEPSNNNNGGCDLHVVELDSDTVKMDNASSSISTPTDSPIEESTVSHADQNITNIKEWVEIIKVILCNALFWSMASWYMALYMMYTFNLDWAPTFLMQISNAEPSTAAYGSVMLSTAGGISVVLIGAINAIVPEEKRYIPFLIWMGGLFLETLFIWYLLDQGIHLSFTLAVFLICLNGFLLLGPYSLPAATLAAKFGGKKVTATLSGLMDAFGSIFQALASVVIGFLTNGEQDTKKKGWTTVYALLSIMMAVSFLAAALYSWLDLKDIRKKQQRNAEKQQPVQKENKQN